MKRLLKIIFIFLIFIPQGLIAQNNSVSINSENTVFQPPAVSASEVAKQLYYAKSIFKDSLVKSLKIVEQNLAVAINSGYQKEEALALNILGEFNMSLTNYPSAIRHLIKANQLYRQQSDKANTIITYDLLGDSYSKNKKSTLAIEQWLKAENLNSQSHANNRKKIEIQIKIGDEYLKISDFIKAKIYYEKALQLAEQTKNDNGIISATIGLGKVEERNGANAAAENLFQIANVKAVNSNSVELTNASLNSLSTLYQNSNNSVERIKIKEQAIDFNNTIGNTTQVIQNSTEMAEILLEDGKDDKAIEVLNQSAPLIQGQANSEAKRNFYKTLSKAYGEKGDIQKAKELEREYNVLMDSFKFLETQKSELISAKNDIIQNTENKISLLEKDRVINEKTIQLLEQDKIIKDESLKSQQTVMVFLGIGLLLVGVIIFFVYRSNQQKQKNNQLLTLKSLRNQMNPHFIFNSLNSVNVYIAQQDERAANKYLADFSKLMRAVLNYSQNDYIPLSKELEILTLYLNLEHDRFKEHFDFTIDCPDSIDLEKYQIPPMLIQPLVENSIWHGLRYKGEKGYLHIDFQESKAGLSITVTDNGIGREQSLKQKTANQLKMKSTGIKNVEDRLEIIKTAFKKELLITITDLDTETKAGTVATVLLKAN